MTWGYVLRFGTVPPIGQEEWKIAFFLFIFWNCKTGLLIQLKVIIKFDNYE